MIRDDLDTTLSVDKCSLVASSAALGRNILKASGSWAGKYNQSATNFWSDYRAGKSATLSRYANRAKRMQNIKQMSVRLKQSGKVAGQGARTMVA
eukprot:4099097-Pyramimonas_sp.AAC.1